MSYDSQIAALSPWGYWKTTEASGNLADSSGNGRTQTVTGSPTYAQTGPGGTADAVSWTNTASQHAETSATTNAGVFTYVAWVYLTGTPASSVAIMSRAIAYNTAGAADGRLFIDSAGNLNFSIFTGVTTTVTAATALPLNTWVMVVASVGAGGVRLRQNKTSMATNAATSAYTGASQLIFIRGGDALMIGTQPIQISRPTYFTTQLSNTDTDALYDTVTAVVNQTVTPPVATATSAGVVPTVSGSSGVTAPPASASSSALPPTVDAPGNAEVLSPAATATATGIAPVVTADAFVTAVAATSTATALPPTVGATASATVLAVTATASAAAIAPFVTYGSPNATVEAPPATATASMLVPMLVHETGSDTSNAFSGRTRGGFGTVELTVPSVAPPSPSATRVDKAVALPVPVLVKGRPT